MKSIYWIGLAVMMVSGCEKTDRCVVIVDGKVEDIVSYRQSNGTIEWTNKKGENHYVALRRVAP